MKALYFQKGHSVLIQEVYSFSKVTDTKLCQEVISYKVAGTRCYKWIFKTIKYFRNCDIFT